MRSLNFTIVFYSVNSDQPGILYTAVIAENVGSWTLSWTLRIVWISIDIFRAFSSLICKKPLSLLIYNFDILILFWNLFFSKSTKMFFLHPLLRVWTFWKTNRNTRNWFFVGDLLWIKAAQHSWAETLRLIPIRGKKKKNAFDSFSAPSSISNLFRFFLQNVFLIWWQHSTMVSLLVLHPAALGLIPCFHQKNWGKIVDVA